MKHLAPRLGALALFVIGSATCGVKQHFHLDASAPAPEREPERNHDGSAVEPPAAGGSSGSNGGAAGGTSGNPGTGGKAIGSGGTGGRRGRGTGGMGGQSTRPDAQPAQPAPRPDAAPPSQPGPTAAGPTIAGMAVPKAKAVVFLHVGHSDMAGRADGPAALRPFVSDTDPKLWVYQKGGTFRPAKEPTAGDSGSAGKGGPGMAILKTALGYAPDVYFISIGHGHSGASGGYCPNFRKGQPLWGLFMDAAIELKGKVTFGGLFTMFGITEYHLGANGLRTTHECIMGLANDVRAELEAPDMPLIVGDWNMGGSGIYSPSGEYGRIVRPLLAMIPMLDKKAGLIPTDGLPMQDDRHLNFQGQKTWAERGLKIMADNNWMPWKP